ncbi:MAG: SEL1-like repeat protein [Sulfitobacter sp.]
MRPNFLISVGFALCLSPIIAAAQDSAEPTNVPDMTQIEQAWQKGNFVAVRTGLEQLSKISDEAMVQYRYGRVLLEGRGGDQDIDAAVEWLQKAVDQNHAEAAALLAKIYLSEFDQDVELNTQRSPERAADLLNLSATLGFAEGQYELARLYEAGLGVPKDGTVAFRWLLAAANQQLPKAQFALARAYLRGVGTDQDTDQAIHWLTNAADNGHPLALLSLARAYEAGNGVEKSMPNALNYYQKAAEGGLPVAQRMLGVRLLRGAQDVTPNVNEGLRWLLSAAKTGDSQAMTALARAYVTGTGVEQSDAEAAVWFKRAAQYDNGLAKTSLAAMYEAGRGVDTDFEAALNLYQQAITIPDGNGAAARLGQLAANGALDGRFAPQRMTPWAMAALRAGSTDAEVWLRGQADAGLRDAQSALASYYLANPETADQGADLLLMAAEAGDAEAGMRLGRMYMTGDHVALDYVAAHQWFNIAATLGQSEAIELRTTVTALMTSDQIAQAQALAREWLANGQPQPPAPEQSVTEAATELNSSQVRE